MGRRCWTRPKRFVRRSEIDCNDLKGGRPLFVAGLCRPRIGNVGWYPTYPEGAGPGARASAFAAGNTIKLLISSAACGLN